MCVASKNEHRLRVLRSLLESNRPRDYRCLTICRTLLKGCEPENLLPSSEICLQGRTPRSALHERESGSHENQPSATFKTIDRPLRFQRCRESANHKGNEPETCLHSKHSPSDFDSSHGSSICSALTRGKVGLQVWRLKCLERLRHQQNQIWYRRVFN